MPRRALLQGRQGNRRHLAPLRRLRLLERVGPVAIRADPLPLWHHPVVRLEPSVRQKVLQLVTEAVVVVQDVDVVSIGAKRILELVGDEPHRREAGDDGHRMRHG